MTLASGTRLGPYKVVALIGAGGMGEVYRARDTRLEREVALKLLPADFAANPQLRLRFEREAKTISQLSHPNICTLYDVGENYLVMELLDGETLADRLARGPLSLAEVPRIGAQIAEALAKAHREGVVHRDLKPGNIMLTKSGAKLLDFGLAKSVGFSAAPAEVTLQKPLTQEGTVLGTFQYMAPEQLAGEEPDARTDIFALGAVLYELVTGRRAFEGKTKTSLVAAITSSEPKPVADLQPLTPPVLEHVIRKCLAKERDDRWQSAADIAEQLRWIGEARTTAGARRPALWPVAVALALMIVLVLAVWVVGRRTVRTVPLYSQIEPPAGASSAFDASSAVISPDGTMIAMVARSADGVTALWLRALDSPNWEMLRGTENPTFPFWSPDSKDLGFFADGKLKRVEITSGTVEALADAPMARGGSWFATGTIVFAPNPASRIMAVPASGGDVRVATAVNVGRFPVALPDGDHFLFFVPSAPQGTVRLGSLTSKSVRVITSAQAGVVFAPPDVLLFVRDGVLRGQHLDLKALTLVGEPFSIAENVQVNTSINFANVSVSKTGRLTYGIGGPANESALKLFDKTGRDLGTIGGVGEQFDVAVAPDGHAVANSRFDRGGVPDVWLHDIARDVDIRETFNGSWAPVWAPDSRTIAFATLNERPGGLFIKRADASGPGQLLFVDTRRKVPTCWSGDGEYIIFNALTPGSNWHIDAWSLRDHKVVPIVETAAEAMNGQLSPDGRWLAYSSTESGRPEIFIRRFLGNEQWQISGGGGRSPRWSPDGGKLYFVSSDEKMMSAAVHTTPSFSADAPEPLFQARLVGFVGVTRSQFDVLPDGRFLVNMAVPGAEKQSPITLVQNWTDALQGSTRDSNRVHR